MKKITILIAVICALSVSCTKGKNSYGWYTDFDSAKNAAKSQKKNILLFVSSFRDFDGAQDAVNMLTQSKDFTKALKNKYVCVYFDFSEADKLSGDAFENSTAAEQKRIEQKRTEMQKQFSTADSYAVRDTPAAILTTADGYYITDVDFDYKPTSIDGYVGVLASEEDSIKEINDMVAAVKKSSGVKKVQAIDALYMNTPETYRIPLADLIKQVPSADKKDESGLVSKYIREYAYIQVYEMLKNLDVDGAVNIYEKTAENPRISQDDKQMLYYAAANTLALTGLKNSDKVIALLRSSYDAAPESEYAETIKLTADNIEKTAQESANEDSAPVDAK